MQKRQKYEQRAKAKKKKKKQFCVVFCSYCITFLFSHAYNVDEFLLLNHIFCCCCCSSSTMLVFVSHFSLLCIVFYLPCILCSTKTHNYLLCHFKHIDIQPSSAACIKFSVLEVLSHIFLGGWLGYIVSYLFWGIPGFFCISPCLVCHFHLSNTLTFSTIYI